MNGRLPHVPIGTAPHQRVALRLEGFIGRRTLALGNVFYHWGGIIVPPGYTDPVQFQTGNPYGTSHLAADGPPDDV
jgi:hypothetical protein